MAIARILYIGDSTVQTNRMDTWPQCGMGQVLELYLRPGVRVENHGKNGRSTKSFLEEGRWAPVEKTLGPGDLLLVQFGHNDEKSQDPSRYSSPADYARRVWDFCRIAQGKGAMAVAVTPLTRRRFREDGLLEDTHGPYPQALRDMAAERGLPLIDLTAESRAWVEGLGAVQSRERYMLFPAGAYARYPEGLTDCTHLRYLGAVEFAGLVAKGLKALGEPYDGVLLEGL